LQGLGAGLHKSAPGTQKEDVRGRILCATRGGEASHRAQNAAIKLAKERDDTLLFLYAADPEFLDKMAEAGVLNTEQELTG
jgi:hypothetical protein